MNIILERGELSASFQLCLASSHVISLTCAMSGSYKYLLEEGEKVILIHIGKNKRAFGGACLHQ